MHDPTLVIRRWGNAVPSGAPHGLAAGCAVVVCTCRRPAALARFLASVDGQRRLDELVIVDASADEESETVVAARAGALPVDRIVYIRVPKPLRGLTRQRNIALDAVGVDLVAFFDDDVILGPDCLDEIVRVHREYGNTVVGVGTFSLNHVDTAPTRLWKLRRTLGIVSALEPGRYSRSGMSIPWSWSFGTERDGPMEGDWLPGYAMSWKTALARQVRFDQKCEGYGQGEDLEFSLRMAARGRLLMTARPCVEHREEPGGRPRPFDLGYMAVYNRYRIHRLLSNRTWLDVAWFTYAWTADTIILARGLLRPRSSAGTISQIAGRAKAACDLLTLGCA